MDNHPHHTHIILARSYIAYFTASIVGLFLESLLSIYMHIPYSTALTMLCFILGTVLIVWAQHSTRKMRHDHMHEFFYTGPYRYIRNPTHVGIFVLIIGYAILTGSIIFLLVSLVGYIVSSLFFMKYEKKLEAMHEEKYVEYKKKVHRVL